MASFIVAGTFPILGVAVMATLPHYFSCEELPPPRRLSPKNADEGLREEIEEMNSQTSPSLNKEAGWADITHAVA